MAAGAGLDVADLNRLIKQHKQMADMMKKMGKGGMMKQAIKQMMGKAPTELAGGDAVHRVGADQLAIEHAAVSQHQPCVTHRSHHTSTVAYSCRLVHDHAAESSSQEVMCSLAEARTTGMTTSRLLPYRPHRTRFTAPSP